MPKLTNVSNPAAWGVEWRAGEYNSEYQLMSPRGTDSLYFGVRHDGGEWHIMSVVGPERFGMSGPVKSFSEFRRIAEAYIDL